MDSYLELLPGDLIRQTCLNMEYEDLKKFIDTDKKYEFLKDILNKKFKSRRAKIINVSIIDDINFEDYEEDTTGDMILRLIKNYDPELIKIVNKNNLKRGDIIRLTDITREYQYLIYDGSSLIRIIDDRIPDQFLTPTEFYFYHWSDIEEFYIPFDIKSFRTQIVNYILNNDSDYFEIDGLEKFHFVTNEASLFYLLVWLNNDVNYITVEDKSFILINQMRNLPSGDRILSNTYPFIVKEFQQRMNKLVIGDYLIDYINSRISDQSYESLNNINKVLVSYEDSKKKEEKHIFDDIEQELLNFNDISYHF